MRGDNPLVKRLRDEFRRDIGCEPSLVRAPGRVNLIGDHTDYSGGYVMPVALQFATWAAYAPRVDRRMTVRSLTLSERTEFDLDDADPVPSGDWSDYVRGVAISLEAVGEYLCGADILVDSDIPIGAGLSSSAAVEVATGYAMLKVAGHVTNREVLVRCCQRAENTFVGVETGIMDQYTSCYGVAGRALLLDCRSLVSKSITLPEDSEFIVANTMICHSLAAGEYNKRRAELEAGVAVLARVLRGTSSLRDVSVEQLDAHSGVLPRPLLQRCRHVVSENARVLAAAHALTSGDVAGFGRLMIASHQSLRDDYEVSSSALDTLFEIALSVDGVYGSRMTGGGFGGCTISLIDRSARARFCKVVTERYDNATGLQPTLFTVCASSGVNDEPVAFGATS